MQRSTDKNQIHKDLAKLTKVTSGATIRDMCDQDTAKKLEQMRRGQS